MRRVGAGLGRDMLGLVIGCRLGVRVLSRHPVLNPAAERGDRNAARATDRNALDLTPGEHFIERRARDADRPSGLLRLDEQLVHTASSIVVAASLPESA